MPSGKVKPQESGVKPLDHPIAVTIFDDRRAVARETETVSTRQLAKRIHSPAYQQKSKSDRRYIKSGRFDGKRSERGAYRTNASHVSVTGIEADYDDGQVGALVLE